MIGKLVELLLYLFVYQNIDHIKVLNKKYIEEKVEELIQKRIQRGLRVITLQEAIEKSPKINDWMAPQLFRFWW